MEEESKLTKYILSPHLGGVYISKSDFINIAASSGYTLQIQERKRMLKELFALVRETDDFIRIVDSFISFVNYKEEQYRAAASAYPASKKIIDTFLAKIKNAKAEFEKAKEEAMLIA